MILAIDIGNTNIVLGCIDNNKTYFIERLSTIKTKMELEYAIDIKMVLDLHGIDAGKLEGAIVSSFVPQITNVIKEATEKIGRWSWSKNRTQYYDGQSGSAWK